MNTQLLEIKDKVKRISSSQGFSEATLLTFMYEIAFKTNTLKYFVLREEDTRDIKITMDSLR